MTALHQYVISTVGGKTIQRSADPARLVDTARQVLEEGWPLFLKSNLVPNNSIEFNRDESGRLVVKPAVGANPKWVERSLEEFRLD